MIRWVALLRGVNVGGGNRVPMADLRSLCRSLGWQNVESYIASGNLVFDAAGPASELATDLRRGLQKSFDVDVPILVLDQQDFQDRFSTCPFPPDAGKEVHGFFCQHPPQLDSEMANVLIEDTEALDVADRMVWMHAPDGFARSALASKIDKVILGTDFTARNLNTIQRLAEMLDRNGAA